MGCNCKDMREEIEDYKKQLECFRKYFWKRLTVDSESQDRRKKDYNQALFHCWSDENSEDESNWFQCFCDMTPQMIMIAFDNAVKDWRRHFCDVENCTRK